MEQELSLLVLLLALAIGWVLGYFYHKGRSQPAPDQASPNPGEKHRLQLLFDSYSDDSLDRFVQSLEVTPETLPLHISIGRHFRAEGEVEKAIFIHQNLMSHPELSRSQAEPVVFELAKDYKAAGLFDRAESLLEQLSSSRAFGLKSRRLLLDVYELEKDWLQALEVGQKIELRKHPDIRLRLAQYYCEIADEKLREQNALEARRLFSKSLSIDKRCVRAQLSLTELAIREENFTEAIGRLRDVIDDSPEYLALALPLLLESTERTKSYASLRSYLEKLYRVNKKVIVMLTIFESFMREGEESAAYEYLEQQSYERPSIMGLQRLLALRKSVSEDDPDRITQMLGDLIAQMYADTPEFLCSNCGFSGKQMHWMCPSCKSWQSIQPRMDVAVIS